MKNTFKCIDISDDVLDVSPRVSGAGGSFLRITDGTSVSSVMLTKKQSLRLARLLIKNAKGSTDG